MTHESDQRALGKIPNGEPVVMVNVIGDGESPWWDAILVVEYPSSQAFSDMVTDPECQQVHGHQAAP